MTVTIDRPYNYVIDEIKTQELTISSNLPEWDTKHKKYILDFNGRVKLPSTSNVQLLLNNDLIVQFGKVREHMYNLDACFPVSLLQAFAIGLSSINFKLGCQ